jgi:hypothetical protein
VDERDEEVADLKGSRLGGAPSSGGVCDASAQFGRAADAGRRLMQKSRVRDAF